MKLAVRVRPRLPQSLHGRVVAGVLALLAALLVLLFVAVDLSLGARLRADLRTRLTDRVTLAEQLDGAMSPQQLVDRLTGDGVQVQLCSPSGTSPRCVSPRVAPQQQRPNPPGKGERPPAPSGAPRAVQPAAATAISESGSVLYASATLPTSGQRLSLAVDRSEVDSTLRGLVVAEAIGGVAALVIAALLLGRVVGVALRPLDDMTRLARRIAAGDRGRRLGTSAPRTELGRTAEAFDAMLEELETAVRAADAARDRLRRFLGDATHELRSPLAGVRARGEQLLRDEPGRAEREQAYVAIVREVRRADRLVEDLLLAARVDEEPALRHEAVDLVALAHDEAERARVRVTAAGVPTQITLRPPAGPVVVPGDRARLAQVLVNLVDNATRAAAGGHVDIAVGIVDGCAVVDVRDDGPGVPAAERERIFERLVRLDESRARDSGGFGLGLSIARGLARAHRGELTCLPSERGAWFRLTVPL